jgi:hypothetical protein
VQYLIIFGSLITNDATCTREIKSKIAMSEATFIKEKLLFISRFGLNLRKYLVHFYIWNIHIVLCGAATGTLQKVDEKYLESFEMWCWRRMEKVSWTEHVNNEEVLHRVEKEGNILHTVKEGRLMGLVTSCIGIVF